MKKICFVMDSLSFVPTGGAKMIFEYANRLQNRGYSVQILYLMGSSWKKYHLPEKALHSRRCSRSLMPVKSVPPQNDRFGILP